MIRAVALHRFYEDGTVTHPWELTRDQFVKYLNNGYVPGEAGGLDNYDDQILLDTLRPVPLDPRWPTARPPGAFWFCRLSFSRDGKGPERKGTIGLVRKSTNPGGREVYELVGECADGHLFLKRHVRKMNLGAELLLASAQNNKSGRPNTTTQYTKGAHVALGRAHRLAVERALKEGLPVPDLVLKDYPDLARP